MTPRNRAFLIILFTLGILVLSPVRDSFHQALFERPKLLDFGLAKLQATETPTNLSALPTEQANLTAEGIILGTLQYNGP